MHTHPPTHTHPKAAADELRLSNLRLTDGLTEALACLPKLEEEKRRCAQLGAEMAEAEAAAAEWRKDADARLAQAAADARAEIQVAADSPFPPSRHPSSPHPPA